jgi:ATP-dependent DNA helicase
MICPNFGRFSTLFYLTSSVTSNRSKNGPLRCRSIFLYTYVENGARFDQPTMQENLTQSHTSYFIHQLHAILKPFLLRRVKADVEIDLPPKKEYVIYCPLSQEQRQLYQHVVHGGLRQFLIGKNGSKDRIDAQKAMTEEADQPMTLRSQKLGRKRKSYASYDDSDDDEFLRKAESGELDMRKDDFRNIEEIRTAHKQKTICELPRACSRSVT